MKKTILVMVMAILALAVVANAGTRKEKDNIQYEGTNTFTGKVAIKQEIANVEILTAADTLVASECGKTIFLNSATEFATALPAISAVDAGCYFKFIVQAAPSGANYTVTSGDSIHGVINVAGTPAACATEDVISFVSGGAVGDWFTVISNGTAWYIDGLSLTAAKLTCTNP